MRSNNNGWSIAGAALLLVSCGSDDAPPVPGAPAIPLDRGEVADGPARVGPPYQVDGVTYTPEDAANYDEVGYAGWYRSEGDGNDTASGEPFVPTDISAAHRTLPLPSYVEVTALDTGKTILVRLNDRGPFANGRIIDLSQGAAEQLGIMGDGMAAVRVRRVSPPEQERSVLRAHGRAAERLETPAPLLAALRKRLGARPMASAAPTPRPLAQKAAGRARAGTDYAPPPDRSQQPAPTSSQSQSGDFIVEQQGAPRNRAPITPAEPATEIEPVTRAITGSYIVQLAAFSSRSRAEDLARRTGAHAVSSGDVWRVRFGPYPTQDAAQVGVRQAASKGFKNARIMANDAP